MRSVRDFCAVGKSILRIDAREKAIGAAKYPIDLKLLEMIYGKIKRSTHPHAKIRGMDTSKAEALPGVLSVITAKDVPDAKYGHGLNDQPLLARDKVRYIGEPIAAVAAVDEDIAEEALELIDVEYEELPAIFNVEEAFKPDCPAIIHEDYPKYENTFFPPAKMDVKRPNVANYFKIRRGDVEKGFKEADVVEEGKFQTARVQHVPMEPHGAIARAESDGSITVWTGSQQPYLLTTQLSGLLKIDPSKIRVIVPYLGGGFGNKTQMKTEAVAIVLAQKTGRPVKITLTREEVFVGTTCRGDTITRIKIGAKKDGTITAMDIEIIYAAGGYTGDSFVYSIKGPFQPVGTYRSPNLKVDSYLVYTNQPVSGAFRGFGNPELNWPIESLMDKVARKLGMDSAEFRMKNLLEEGEENAFGEITHSTGARECIQKVLIALEWGKEIEREKGVWKRGRGIAMGNKYSVAPSASCAIVKVHHDGVIEVRTSAIEIGQGTLTALAQIAAEEFKVSIEKVKMITCDTAITPFDFGTVSSRTTYHVGNAIIMACQDAKNQMFELAAEKLGANPRDLETEAGKIYVKGSSQAIEIRDIFEETKGMGHIGRYIPRGGEILGKATFFSKIGKMDPETSQLLDKREKASVFWTHVANGVEIEVNVDTGEINVLKFASAVDVGKAINPVSVEGQIQGGGLSMGIGIGLYEQMVLENGKCINAAFKDYRIPHARDLPSVENTYIEIVEAPHREGPYGAKGLGEATMLCTPAAIASAIYDAVGVRVNEIPITHEKLLNALSKR